MLVFFCAKETGATSKTLSSVHLGIMTSFLQYASVHAALSLIGPTF